MAVSSHEEPFRARLRICLVGASGHLFPGWYRSIGTTCAISYPKYVPPPTLLHRWREYVQSSRGERSLATSIIQHVLCSLPSWTKICTNIIITDHHRLCCSQVAFSRNGVVVALSSVQNGAFSRNGPSITSLSCYSPFRKGLFHGHHPEHSYRQNVASNVTLVVHVLRQMLCGSWVTKPSKCTRERATAPPFPHFFWIQSYS